MHFAMICCLPNHIAKIHIFFDTDAFLVIFLWYCINRHTYLVVEGVGGHA